MKCVILAVLILLPAKTLRAQSVAQAHQFLQSTYDWDTNVGADDPFGETNHYTISLIRLFRLDERRAGKGNIGKLDYDPLCSCQDPGGLRYEITSVQQSRHSTIKARIKLTENSIQPVEVALDLQWTSRGWLINDVHTSKTPSLREFLAHP